MFTPQLQIAGQGVSPNVVKNESEIIPTWVEEYLKKDIEDLYKGII
jgi:hypothetical protein